MDDFYSLVQSVDLTEGLGVKEDLLRASQIFHSAEGNLSKKEWQKVLVKLEEVIRHTVSLKGLFPPIKHFYCMLKCMLHAVCMDRSILYPVNPPFFALFSG